MTDLTAKDFDAIASHRSREPRIIWTLSAIGRRIGRGRDFAEALAMMPGTPIRRQGRQYYAFEDELLHYMHGDKPYRPSSHAKRKAKPKTSPR